jgi:hypothetical protein
VAKNIALILMWTKTGAQLYKDAIVRKYNKSWELTI